MKLQTELLVLVGALALAHSAMSGPVSGLTDFTAGTPARASEVNGNFAAVKTAVDDNDSRIGTLLTRLATLEASMTALQAENSMLKSTVQTQGSTIATLQSQVSNVAQLNGVVSLTSSNGVPTVRFSNVNVQVVNGQGITDSVTGTGNLIVGYDEARTIGRPHCSFGFNRTDSSPVTTEEHCRNGNGIWALNHKSGSHNLIVGSRHNYSRVGGTLFGILNSVTEDYSTVAGGFENHAGGSATFVGGGFRNFATGTAASILGGEENRATGADATVSGGRWNVASGAAASISGGRSNNAVGNRASISGGVANHASGVESSIGGGESNRAEGVASSVSGGLNDTASGEHDWRAGDTVSSDQ